MSNYPTLLRVIAEEREEKGENQNACILHSAANWLEGLECELNICPCHYRRKSTDNTCEHYPDNYGRTT